MTYNVDAIKRKIQELTVPDRKKTGDAVRLTWFKPGMGPNEIRFLPYDDGHGQPFQAVGYYNSKQLYERRIVAPVQYGRADPISDLMTELRKERQDDATWQLMKELRVKESYYAPVLVRGQEDKGVQIWELGSTVLKKVYSVLAHPDYVDENMFHPTEGYDFTVTCTDSGKTTTFNGKVYTVKDYDVTPRRKPSVLDKDESVRNEIVAAVPNLSEHFGQFVMKEEN